jgi:hypothetical protein
MEVVISTVNFIRKHGLNHHQFRHFLEEIVAEFGDVLYYAEVRWLSRGSVLRRFFNLRAAIEIFMNKKSKSVPELSVAERIIDLAFFIDITSLLNKVNMKLQDKGKLLPEVFLDIKASEIKLKLIISMLKSETSLIFLSVLETSGEKRFA